MSLAQYTDDNGLELGGLFNGLKRNIEDYDDVINKLKGLNALDIFKDGKVDVDAFTKALGTSDSILIGYTETLKDTDGVVNLTMASTEGLSEYLKKTGQSFNFAAIKATLLNTALNAGIFLVASVAIQGMVKAVDNWIHRVEKANEAMSDAVGEYESAKSSLKSITTELDEQQKKLDELSAKDKLTYAEKGQLEELQAITKELLIQQDIEERRADKASKNAADKTVNAYKTQYGGYDLSKEDLYARIDSAKNSGIFPLTEGKDDVIGNITAYTRAMELLTETQEKYTAALEKKEDTSWLDSEVQHNTDLVEELSQMLDDNLSDLQEKRLALEEEYNKAIEKRENGTTALTSSDQEIISTYESIYDVIKMVYEYTNQNDWNEIEIADIFNSEGIEKTKEELISMAKAGELTPDTIAGYENLNRAIQDSELFLKDNQTAAAAFCEEIYGCAEAAKAMNGELDEIAVSTFEQAWADSFTSENDKVKELGNTLLDLAEKGRLTKETFNEADSTAGDYFKNLGVSADEAVLKINKLVDESNQLSSMSSQISSMAEALGTKLNDGFVSADTLSGFDVEVRGLESWDRFQEVLGSTTSSYEECQEAANALATEWVNSSDFLAQLTEQNREYYETQLEAMGIENYKEVISYAQALNEAKEVLSQSSLMLGEATQDEIEALIAEGTYSELAANMILALYDAKVAEQAATIDTASDCENLIALAGDADRTSQSIQLLISLMNIYSELESGVYDNNAAARTGALGIVNRIKGELEALANGETKQMEIEPTVKLGSKGKSSAKSAGKKAGKSLKEGLKEELSDLENVISGVTGRIDDQISVIKSQKEAALESIDAQIDALNEQKSALEAQKKALEAERDARIEIIEQQKKQLEQQIKLIDKQIKEKEKILKSINDEIDAMRDANDERQRQIDLQKAQYELERLQHQRTMLVYSEEKGMHYVNDSKGIRDAKDKVDDAKLEIEIANKQKQIDLIEKEIDLLNEKKDAINEQIDILDEQIDEINEYYDAQIKAIDTQIESIDKQIAALQKQREETEKYYESLIENLEKSKSKYQELTELVEKAELSAKLKQLGIDEEALVNGSEEEFEKLKKAYMDVVFKLNEGNEEVMSSLRELSGYEGTAPAVLTETAEKLDEVNEQLDDSAESMDKLSTSATTADEGTSAVAASMGELNTSTEGLSDNLTSINDALTGLPEAEKITAVSDAFTNMGEAIKSVADALGVGEEGTVGGLVGALQSLSELSLGEADADGQGGSGILSQFQALKTAVDDVTNAISGGGSSGGSGGGGDASTSSSPSMSSGAGEGGSGGLVGAVESFKNAADEALGSGGGEEGSEGDGEGSGAIGQFGQLKEAVDDVTAAIGSGDSEGGEGGSGEEDAANLIGAINQLGETTEEILAGGGESDGESGGVIGRFEEFKDVIGEANEHVTGISEGLAAIDVERHFKCSSDCAVAAN